MHPGRRCAAAIPQPAQYNCVTQVLPEFQTQNVDELPVLKADALKFPRTLPAYFQPFRVWHFVQVLPELQAQNVNDLPVLKADALKFLTTFRSQIPKDACLRIFERLIALLGSESNVVHTYAATAVERLLSSKVIL